MYTVTCMRFRVQPNILFWKNYTGILMPDLCNYNWIIFFCIEDL